MKNIGLSKVAIFAGIVTTAACSQMMEFARLPYAPRANVVHARGAVSPLTYSVLYSFDRLPDGNLTATGLIDVNGTFYGTTYFGGMYTGIYGLGLGTVYYIKKGEEHILYSFDGTDGASPAAGLINVNGTLYGTTQSGGTYYSFNCYTYSSCGTVFSITTGGKLHVLHDFSGGSADGALPAAGLINVKGTLYGTTLTSGKYGDGTVFSITTTGTENVLRDFGWTDGAYPAAGVIAVNGTLYGTTGYGGSHGNGTVFSTPIKGGSANVLHNFGHGTDGSNPAARLINVSGTLYGTTENGGTLVSRPQGTVFAIKTDGKDYGVLVDFDLTDGGTPAASLIHVNDTLYGTTEYGGAHGFGTLFSIPKYGTEKVLHSFGSVSTVSSPPRT